MAPPLQSPLGSKPYPLMMWLLRRAVAQDLKRIEAGTFLDHKRATVGTRAKSSPLISLLMMRRSPATDREEITIPRPDGSPLRLVIHSPRRGGERPIYVNIHGGGFYLGSPEDVDNQSAQLAHHADVTVVSPDYRLVPEHPFPAGLDDVMTTVRWARDRSSALGVGGGSAGGNLAAVASRLCRDEGIALQVAILEVPLLDLTEELPALDGLQELNAFFHAEGEWTKELYDADHSDPLVSPSKATDLAGLPPTYVLACDHDPLVFQEQRYVNQLQAAGVEASFQVFPGLTHGFSGLTRLFPAARDWETTLISILRRELRGAA